jgi:hypothetical protein
VKELQKPLQDDGKPAVEMLVAAFTKAAEDRSEVTKYLHLTQQAKTILYLNLVMVDLYQLVTLFQKNIINQKNQRNKIRS